MRNEMLSRVVLYLNQFGGNNKNETSSKISQPRHRAQCFSTVQVSGTTDVCIPIQ